MSRLPNPGGDNGQWGVILNDFLSVTHATDGTVNPGVITKANLVAAVQTSLGKADTALQSVTKSDVGLANVDNTSDLNKPISTATQTALNGKIGSSNGTILNDIVVTQAQMDALIANGTAVATTRYTIVG
jgi:hypothetical protein